MLYLVKEKLIRNVEINYCEGWLLLNRFLICDVLSTGNVVC